MKDVELVIRIPEEDYTFFKESYSHLKIKEHLIDTRDNRCYIAIANGTPLSEGHGDIVDMKTLADMFWDGNFMELTKDDLSAVKPIIEADKSESEA